MDNNTNTLTSLECKEYVKYLGVLIDSHSSWKFHIDYVAFKLSKIVGIIVADVVRLLTNTTSKTRHPLYEFF